MNTANPPGAHVAETMDAPEKAQKPSFQAGVLSPETAIKGSCDLRGNTKLRTLIDQFSELLGKFAGKTDGTLDRIEHLLRTRFGIDEKNSPNDEFVKAISCMRIASAEAISRYNEIKSSSLPIDKQTTGIEVTDFILECVSRVKALAEIKNITIVPVSYREKAPLNEIADNAELPDQTDTNEMICRVYKTDLQDTILENVVCLINAVNVNSTIGIAYIMENNRLSILFFIEKKNLRDEQQATGNITDSMSVTSNIVNAMGGRVISREHQGGSFIGIEIEVSV